MKNFLSRFAAIAATTAMLASYATIPAYAAGVVTTVASGNQQNFTIDLPTNLSAGVVMTLRITTTADGLPVDLAANPITSATLGAGAVETLTNSGDVNGRAVITESGNDEAAGADLVFALTNPLADNLAYTIAYSDSEGNISAAMINFGTANVVTVTAIVEPTLTLTLANPAVSLGILSPAAVTSSTIDPTATVATNALTGFTLTATDDDGVVGGLNASAGLDSNNASTTIAAATDGAVSSGVAEFGIVVTKTADPQTNGSVTANPTLTTTGVAIAAGTGPTTGVQATVDVQAAISAITPAASDYTTSLTFTATANF